MEDSKSAKVEVKVELTNSGDESTNKENLMDTKREISQIAQRYLSKGLIKGYEITID